MRTENAANSRAGDDAMRYGDEDRESPDVEDRRSERGPMFRFPGSGGGADGRVIQIPLTGGSIGTLIVIGLVLWVVGINARGLLSEGASPRVPQMPNSEPVPGRQANRTGSPDIPGLPGGTA